jgi:hypothetical protein
MAGRDPCGLLSFIEPRGHLEPIFRNIFLPAFGLNETSKTSNHNHRPRNFNKSLAGKGSTHLYHHNACATNDDMPSAIPILLRMGTFAGGVIMEPSRSFLGPGEVAAVCGLLLHS